MISSEELASIQADREALKIDYDDLIPSVGPPAWLDRWERGALVLIAIVAALALYSISLGILFWRWGTRR